MRFRGAQDHAPADVGEGAPDIDAAAIEINVADAQSGSFAPAQARVAEHQDQKPPGASCDGQVKNLTMSQEYVVTVLGSGQPQAMSWVGANPAASDGVIKRGGHDERRLPYPGGAKAAEGEPCNPLSQVLECDLG